MCQKISYRFKLFLQSLDNFNIKCIPNLVREYIDVKAFSEKESLSIVFLLLQCWGKNHHYTRSFGIGECLARKLSCEQVTCVIQEMQLENLFFKVFLLLENKMQQLFLDDLTNYLDTSKNISMLKTFLENIFKFICTHERALFVKKQNSVKININICNFIFQLKNYVDQQYGTYYLIQMIDRILEEILKSELSYNSIKHTEPSVVDESHIESLKTFLTAHETHIIRETEKLANCTQTLTFLKELFDTVNIYLNCEHKIIFSFDKKNEHWMIMLYRLLSLKKLLARHENSFIQDVVVDTLVAVIEEHLSLDISVDVKSKSNIDYQNLLTMKYSPNYYKWKSIENPTEKFKQALHRLSMLYYNTSEISDWLLDEEHYIPEFSQEFVSVYSDHVINFGSLDTVKNILIKYYKCMQKFEEKDFVETLLKILISIFPHLKLTSSNQLINELKEYHNIQAVNVNLNRQFKALVNESLNKIANLRDNTSENSSLHNVIGCFVIAPLHMIKELIDRVFVRNLNDQVFLKIVECLPSLIELSSEGCADPYIIVETENSYKESKIYGYNVDDVLVKLMTSLFKVNENHVTSTKLEQSMYSWFKKRFTEDVINAETPVNISVNICRSFLTSAKTSKNIQTFDELLNIASYLQLLSNVNDVTFPWELYECHHVIDECTGLLKDRIQEIHYSSIVTEKNYIEEKLYNVSDNPGNMESFLYFFIVNSSNTKRKWFLTADWSNLIEETEITSKNIYSIENDSNKWENIFHLWICNKELAKVLISATKPTNAEDELSPMINVLNKMTSPVVSKWKMSCMIQCIEYMVDNGKLTNYFSYLHENHYAESQLQSRSHAASFSLYICIQCYKMKFADVAILTKYDQFNLNNFILVFHDYLLYAKSMDNYQNLVVFLGYFTEQLISSISLVSQTVGQVFTLLLKDLIAFCISTSKRCSEGYEFLINIQSIVEQCTHETLRSELLQKLTSVNS